VAVDRETVNLSHTVRRICTATSHQTTYIYRPLVPPIATPPSPTSHPFTGFRRHQHLQSPVTLSQPGSRSTTSPWATNGNTTRLNNEGSTTSRGSISSNHTYHSKLITPRVARMPSTNPRTNGNSTTTNPKSCRLPTRGGTSMGDIRVHRSFVR
jgi:hypothetical protein